MFAFGLIVDDQFKFVQTSDKHVYTYPSETLAREYFRYATHHSHLYRVDNDLSVAHLIEAGDNTQPAPHVVTLTEDQKLALWSSYVYKSLLAWCPYPETVR